MKDERTSIMHYIVYVHTHTHTHTDSVPFPTEVNGGASSDSETILVSWSVPPDDCFTFLSFTVSCVSLEGSVTSTGRNIVDGGFRSALVRDLTPDTFYNCSVESHFNGFTITTVSYASGAIFTFPPSELADVHVCHV